MEPNAETSAAMAEAHAIISARIARFFDAGSLFADLEAKSSEQACIALPHET